MNQIEALASVDTCAVSDALDHFGLPGATLGLTPLWPTTDVVVGRVRTVQAGPRPPDGVGIHIATPAVASATPGDVIVIANSGRTDVSCWGGILAYGARSNGVAAVVIDGACRDITESQRLGLPVYGRAVVPVSARGRIVQLDMDVPITVAGVVVSPGDLLIADACGVAFIAAADADRVIARALAVVAREQRMVESVQAGQSIIEVMQDSHFEAIEEN